MARVCKICGKGRSVGMNVSHANNKIQTFVAGKSQNGSRASSKVKSNARWSARIVFIPDVCKKSHNEQTCRQSPL